jgi:hypothetical protein
VALAVPDMEHAPPLQERIEGRSERRRRGMVRLRRCALRVVKVRSPEAETSRGIQNLNCGVATYRGEQRERNDQSVTMILLGRRTQ